MVKQPANTWSNVAFMLIGLAIMLMLGGNSARPRNPMQIADFFSIGYGMAVVFLGPGSMFFHASLKRWGGWVDNLSMNLFVSFVIVYDFVRVVHGNEIVFLMVYLVINVTLGVVTALRDGLGKYIFGGLIAAFAILEVLILVFHAGGVTREFLPYMLLTLISFGLAFGIWLLSNTGGPLCKRDTLLQGHAIWHVLTAISTLFIYLYLLSEVRP